MWHISRPSGSGNADQLIRFVLVQMHLDFFWLKSNFVLLLNNAVLWYFFPPFRRHRGGGREGEDRPRRARKHKPAGWETNCVGGRRRTSTALQILPACAASCYSSLVYNSLDLVMTSQPAFKLSELVEMRLHSNSPFTNIGSVSDLNLTGINRAVMDTEEPGWSVILPDQCCFISLAAVDCRPCEEEYLPSSQQEGHRMCHAFRVGLFEAGIFGQKLHIVRQIRTFDD